MAKLTVESGVKKGEIFLITMGIVIICLFCRAGYNVNKDPYPPVFVNNLPIEEVK